MEVKDTKVMRELEGEGGHADGPKKHRRGLSKGVRCRVESCGKKSQAVFRNMSKKAHLSSRGTQNRTPSVSECSIYRSLYVVLSLS